MLSIHHTATRRPPHTDSTTDDDTARPALDPPASPTSSSHPPPTRRSVDPTVSQHHSQPTQSTPANDDEEDEVQQCWICYTDSLEDKSRPFLHACQCTLVAHEQCLLDWLTAQAHSPAHRSGPPRCPVCASPIVVRQHRSPLLRLYRRMRRTADHASLVATVGGVAASGWFVAASYGAWAVRTFMGDQVAHALVLRNDSGGLPWRYWLNLPLIPLTLVLSRTPLIDSLLPFLPLTLVLSARPHTLPLPLLDPLGLDDLTLRYPPSPTLTLCLLPWLRLLYLRLRLRLFHAVLGRRKKFRGLAGVFEEAAEDDNDADDADDDDVFAADDAADGARRGPAREPLELVATLEVDVEERPAARPAPAAARAPPPPTTSRLRIGLSRLTSLVVGALVFPALASLAGDALLWLARRRGDATPLRALRAALGVGAVLAASRGGAGVGSGGGAGWFRRVVASGTGGAGPGPGPRPGGVVVDPKWLRSTLGAALVLVVRDACELAAGVLELRRRRSRRVVERAAALRPGAGVASSGGAGGEARARAPEGGRRETGDERVSSGGRDAQGREAVVHTLL